MLSCCRLRDCVKVDMFLCVNSQPIIESSSGITVGCFQYNYSKLADHLAAAGLTPWNNYWAQVYDFSPVQAETHWKKAGRMFKVGDYLPLPSEPDLVTELAIGNIQTQLTSYLSHPLFLDSYIVCEDRSGV